MPRSILDHYIYSDRPRDSQFSKTFKACEEIRKLDKGLTFEQGRDFYMKACRSPFVEKMATAHPQRMARGYPLEVALKEEGTLKQTCSFNERGNNTWPYHTRIVRLGASKVEILEVLAHILAPYNEQMHGPEFVSTFLKLLKRFMGPEFQQKAKKIFLDHKVKTKAVSKETRLKQRKNFLDRRYPEAKEELLKSLREE